VKAADLEPGLKLSRNIANLKDNTQFFAMVGAVMKSLKTEEKIEETAINTQSFLKLNIKWGYTLPSSLLPVLSNISAVIDIKGTSKKNLEGKVSTFVGSVFNSPWGISVNAEGDICVADKYNQNIKKVTCTGLVSQVAGSARGFAEGRGSQAMFKYPSAVTSDAEGHIYVADCANNRIRKITRGVTTTIAGSGVAGFMDDVGSKAMFDSPTGIALDEKGNVLVADCGNSRIRKITQQGVVSTITGNGMKSFADGAGSQAMFNEPSAIVLDSMGNMFVADSLNQRIRKITPQGVVSTLAGGGTPGHEDGISGLAKFNSPSGVAVDVEGNVYVADRLNNRVRRVTPQGEVTTIAGSAEAGFEDGVGAMAKFKGPAGIALDADGNLYVADSENNSIRKIV